MKTRTLRRSFVILVFSIVAALGALATTPHAYGCGNNTGGPNCFGPSVESPAPIVGRESLAFLNALLLLLRTV